MQPNVFAKSVSSYLQQLHRYGDVNSVQLFLAQPVIIIYTFVQHETYTKKNRGQQCICNRPVISKLTEIRLTSCSIRKTGHF